MARTSPVHYIAPSAISITPNANGSHRDLAVYVAKGAKIKVLCPRAGIGYVKNEYQEWTLSGRNRRLADTTGTVPYTIYARLKKTGDKTGYLVFVPKSENGTDKYQYLTLADNAINGITSIDGATTSYFDWYIRLGDVSAAENGQRTVTLDTGILGTDQYNEKWALNPDLLPLRIELGCTIDDEDAGPTPYVYWGQQLVLTATLTEGWTGTDIKRFDHWEITRDSGDSDADNAWNHPTGAGSYRGLTDGQITLTHARGVGDDFNGAVAATFTVVAMGHPEEGSESQDLVALKTAVINIHAETVERYELAMTANIVGYNPMTQAYDPDSITLRIRATDQRGDVFEMTKGQIDNAGLEVQYAAVGSSGWRTLDFTGASDVVGTATLITATAFAAQQSINVRLVRIIDTDGGSSETELTQQTIAFVRDGEDSKVREWIFYRSTKAITFGTVQNPYPADVTGGEVNPSAIADGSDSDKNQDGWVPEGWTDERLGADDTYRYEYSSYRDYVRGGDSSSSGDVGGWGPFSEPRVQSHWGADGKTSVRIDLDNPHEDFLYSDDSDNTHGGRVSDPVTTQARLYDGGELVNTGVTWSIDPSLSYGVVLSDGQSPYFAWLDNSTPGLLHVEGIYAQSSFVTVKAVYGDNTYYAKFTANMCRQDKYSLVLTPNAVAYNSATYATQVVAVAVTRLDIGGAKSDVVFASGGDDFYNPVKISSTSGCGLLRLFVTYRKKSGDNVSQVTEQILSETFSITAGADNVADLNDDIYFELRKYASADAANSSTYKIMDYDTVPITKAENGDPAIVYTLIPSLSSVHRDSDHIPSVDSISFKVSKTVGGTTSEIGNWNTEGLTLYHNIGDSDVNDGTVSGATKTLTGIQNGLYYENDSVEWILKKGSSVVDRKVVGTVDDGSPGDAGLDAWTLAVSPQAVIITQSKDDPTDFGLSASNPRVIAVTARCGNHPATVILSSVGASIPSGVTLVRQDNTARITAISTYGDSYPQRFDIQLQGSAIYGSRSYSFTLTVPVAVNLMGTIKTTIQGDVETTVASRVTSEIDSRGLLTATQAEATYIRSADLNVSELREEVDGAVSAVSRVEQTATQLQSRVTDSEGNIGKLQIQARNIFLGLMDGSYQMLPNPGFLATDIAKWSYSATYWSFTTSGSIRYASSVRKYTGYNNNVGILKLATPVIMTGGRWYTLGFDLSLASAASSTPIFTGTVTIAGQSASNPTQLLAMPMKGGEEYNINVRGFILSGGGYLTVGIYSSGGSTPLAATTFNSTDGSIRTITLTAPADGTYYVKGYGAGQVTLVTADKGTLRLNITHANGFTGNIYVNGKPEKRTATDSYDFYFATSATSYLRQVITFECDDNLEETANVSFYSPMNGLPIRIIRPRLEEGMEARGFGSDIEGLARTGIDIERGKITAVADQFEWQNRDGDQIMGLDAAGNAEFAGIVRSKGIYHSIGFFSVSNGTTAYNWTYQDGYVRTERNYLTPEEYSDEYEEGHGYVSACIYVGCGLLDIIYLRFAIADHCLYIPNPQGNEGKQIEIYKGNTTYQWHIGTDPNVANHTFYDAMFNGGIIQSNYIVLTASTIYVRLLSNGEQWYVLERRDKYGTVTTIQNI